MAQITQRSPSRNLKDFGSAHDLIQPTTVGESIEPGVKRGFASATLGKSVKEN